jgi:hypothetical protein
MGEVEKTRADYILTLAQIQNTLPPSCWKYTLWVGSAVLVKLAVCMCFWLLEALENESIRGGGN